MATRTDDAPVTERTIRISQVTVKRLFGIFDHSVPMNLDDRITIIHGPNGFGKTVLLRILDTFFSGRYNELKTIPFRSFEIAFEDGGLLRVKRTISSTDRPQRRITKISIELTEPGSAPLTHVVASLPRDATHGIHFSASIFEDIIPGLDRVGPESWFYHPTQEELTLEDVLERFGEHLPHGTRKGEPEPPWLTEFRQRVPLRFIETQRLLRAHRSRRHAPPTARPAMQPAVAAYADELSTTIQSTLADYANISQSLDRTFPTRLITGYNEAGLTIDQLRNELASLEEKRSRLIEAGLLDSKGALDFREFQAIDERNRNVLSVYVRDVSQKLHVFDDLSQKLDLFKQIINSRFQYKEIAITPREGFVFKTSDGHNLLPSNLSSGEQHVLVLFYELLFKVKPNSLILIDEPELSLHVGWQQQFLKDLGNITRLGSFDVLIATHSPQIIHDRWDLTVELKGP